MRRNREKYKSEMDKSRLKWNSQCGVLRHNPYVIQINIAANLPQRGSYREMHKSDREPVISTSTASFTRLSDPYSGKNPSLFLPSLAGLVIFLL